MGEPDSKKDVYGYWLFIVGYLVSFAGIGLFLSGLPNSGVDGVNVFYWRLSVTLAAVGMPLAMLGIVLLLPVRWRGVQVTLVGAAVSGAGVLGFIYAYPQHWRSGANYTSEIVAVYTVGIAVMAGVAVLVPVVTGKQGMFVEDELLNLADQPPVLIGDATAGTLFSVFRTPEKDWTWRAIQQDAVADSTRAASSRTAARESVEEVRELVGRAGLLEITTAAFRLYENDDEWRWVLMQEDGGVVAESGATYDVRDEVEGSVSFTKDHAPSAPLIEIDGAAVDYYREGDDWHWRLLDEDRRALATDVGAHADRDAAEASVGEMQSLLPDARVLALEGVGAELYEDGDEWRWRLIDADDESLATSAAAFDARRLAESSVDNLLDDVADATVVERGSAGYEVYPEGNDWHWRLLDDGDEVVARDHEPADTADEPRDRAETMARTADAATVVSVEGADYEIYPGEGGWHWRFVTEDRTIVADREGGYESPEEAREVIETVREQASEADLIEFETAAFQQYQTDDDSWRWRLIDEGGDVLADSGQAYDSKAGAGEAMQTLKDTAPDAEILEIETAAFELISTDGGEWRWRLIDEGGYLVAEGATAHPSRQAAREAMDLLVDLSPDANVREMADPVFQVYDDEGDWNWRFVTVDNETIADGTAPQSTRDDATDHVADVRAAAAGAPVDVVESYGIELAEDGAWSWRVFDTARDEVATGTREYERRESAASDVDLLRRHADTAPIFEIETAAVRLVHGDEGYGWVLIDDERETYARSGRRYETRASVMDAIEDLREIAPDAGAVNFDDAGFELFDDGDGWRWRLLDEEERAVATGATPYDTREAARDRVETVRDLVAGASVLEIDDPAFELHYQDDGWIWRLVDSDGDSLAQSIEVYPTRGEAREAMQTLKEQAPEGHVTVAQ
ncbi:DUF1508 domain-containing protein [Halostella sp. JP-L12]|uniref:DUF1508 domain-containing protein n=1 Tax=Halostella TaxID=1843185 RepID=UPI000EF79B87|nr:MULTISPECIES: DUF1508 domain-containing protein [Halostella]NHN47538.1 DUF1508 domain-containing protein [Halostella sp. JP-L12]